MKPEWVDKTIKATDKFIDDYLNENPELKERKNF